MFMQVAVGAVGIGIVLMVGYLVIAQVKSALPTVSHTVTNPCYNMTEAHGTTACNATCYPTWDNTSLSVGCEDMNVSRAMNSTQSVVFAGFALIAVGIIVLAAFSLINIFQ